MRHINEIVVHCSATRENKYFDIRDIRDWHVKGNGWNDVGYHYLVLLDGTIQVGRPVSKAGAGVRGRNRNTIHVCYVGGLDSSGKPKDTRTVYQKIALKDLMRKLCTTFKTINRISGHREYAAKACPCFDARSEYNENIHEYRVVGPVSNKPKPRGSRPVPKPILNEPKALKEGPAVSGLWRFFRALIRGGK